MPRHRKEQQARKASRTRMEFDPYLGRTNAVGRSIAKTASQQQPVSLEETLRQRVKAARLAIRNLNPDLYYCFILQLEYSLRISEVLSITPTDVTEWGEIRIRGKKGSADRFINSDSVREFVIRKRMANVPPFQDLNEDYVRRTYKAVGLFVRLPGRQKDSVTHIFRHLSAMSARTNNYGNEVITSALGHKSSKSQEHYGK